MNDFKAHIPSKNAGFPRKHTQNTPGAIGNLPWSAQTQNDFIHFPDSKARQHVCLAFFIPQNSRLAERKTAFPRRRHAKHVTIKTTYDD